MYVYDRNADLMGPVAADVGDDEVTIDVEPSQPGPYLIIIDSPEGQASSSPYFLEARSIGGPAE
ncbi:MAG: hypothetical protein HW416_2107, partial [Chloroflexi bacterium]|nr:hypothetical protein [Chloroflexota bacterium]